MRTFIVIFFVMVLFYWVTDEPKQEIHPVYQQADDPKPDPNREVAFFDWKAYKYVYKDQLPKEKPIEYSEEDFKAYPDYTVRILDEDKPAYKPRRMKYRIVDGKRYRIIEKPNGDELLVPSR